MNRKLILPGVLLIFASYLFGEYILLVCMKAEGWGAFAVTGCWTAFWLLSYTPFVGNIAVELHEDRERRKMFPKSKDINEDIDEILRKEG